jgi:hypothetical protein
VLTDKSHVLLSVHNDMLLDNYLFRFILTHRNLWVNFAVDYSLFPPGQYPEIRQIRFLSQSFFLLKVKDKFIIRHDVVIVDITSLNYL